MFIKGKHEVISCMKWGKKDRNFSYDVIVTWWYDMVDEVII